jgi:hypothetical protein
MIWKSNPPRVFVQFFGFIWHFNPLIAGHKAQQDTNDNGAKNDPRKQFLAFYHGSPSQLRRLIEVKSHGLLAFFGQFSHVTKGRRTPPEIETGNVGVGTVGKRGQIGANFLSGREALGMVNGW